jgi:hypothetical protein
MSKPATKIRLSLEDEGTLQRWIRASIREQRLALRAGIVLAAAAVLYSLAALKGDPSDQKPIPMPQQFPFVWPSQPPTDCPFEKSENFTALQLTGRHAEYAAADTWYPSWALDDRMYSPFADGTVNGVRSFCGYRDSSESVKGQMAGFAVIEGDDPLRLSITRVGLLPHEPFPYGGQYPCGSLIYNGVWYYGSYLLDWHKNAWDIMGPFVGFEVSTDYGKTWQPEARTAKNPLFRESAKNGLPIKMFSMTEEYEKSPYSKSGEPGNTVKIGAPHFVDFGKNMEHSPDGKAYLVAQGQTRPILTGGYAASDQVYLVRVKPSPETINDPKAYEFFAGCYGKGQPIWSRDFGKIKPLLEWNGHLGVVTATYVPPLKRYLMPITDTRGPKADGNGPYDTCVLESQTLTGPWKLVTYMRTFGEQGYFVNFPTRFISPDGRTLWMCYSGNWSYKGVNVPGCRYGLCLLEVCLLGPKA